MALSAVDVIGPAFERMKQQLFKPFRLGQWSRLAVTGLLAGEMGSAGGCNVNRSFNRQIPLPNVFSWSSQFEDNAKTKTDIVLVPLVVDARGHPIDLGHPDGHGA